MLASSWYESLAKVITVCGNLRKALKGCFALKTSWDPVRVILQSDHLPMEQVKRTKGLGRGDRSSSTLLFSAKDQIRSAGEKEVG